MPVATKRTPGVPEGTRYTTVKVDAPRDAIKSQGGRTRALTYAANAIDRAAQEWFKEHQAIPDWEVMHIEIVFTTFQVVVTVDDRAAHVSTSMG